MLEPRILEAVDDVRDEVDLEPGGPEPGLGLLGQLACGQPRLVYRGVQGQEGTQPAGTNNPYFRDITRNAEENEIVHELFRVLYRFPRHISCYYLGKIDYLWDSACIWVFTARSVSLTVKIK